ncbi:MAG: hypothetical protein IRZ28_06995 [Steroidobacteraceae bacterium]|nr:hypothetical protein [Steroidobacteraceae bacterium]
MPKRVGHSATVQFGVVRSTEQVALDSKAAQGALLGGTLGLITSGNNSRAGGAIQGATVGGIAAAATAGNRKGTAYTVAMLDGSSTRIVSDQREIHEGDCVAIERSGSSANIRRAAPSYCDPANAKAIQEVDPAIRTAAAECQSAKRELAEASSDAEVDLAARKIELLCYD